MLRNKGKLMQLHKLVILGDGGVGKTALVIQLCLNHFVETYDPTIEDSYRKQVLIDGASCMLEVLDTAGQEEYTALRDQWIRDGDAFALVYSIASASTFARIRGFHNRIMRVKESGPSRVSQPPPVCLVGNKSDKVTEREVSSTQGFELALELGVDYFVESSAKNCINVEKAFYDLVRALRFQDDVWKRPYQTRQTLLGPQLAIPKDERNTTEGRARLARSLVNAARTNNIKEVLEFLDAGADVNAQPSISGSALHAAAALGYLTLVSTLLKRGAGINVTAPSGVSPLQDAAAGGHLDVVKLPLQKGASRDQKSGVRGTALHAAASQGRADVLRCLLERGASATEKAGPYEYALHAGAWFGSREVVDALLDAGANIGEKNVDGCTSVHMAAFTGSVDTLQTLLGRGGLVHINAVTDNFGTALDAADDNGHFQAVQVLLEAGASKSGKGSRRTRPMLPVSQGPRYPQLATSSSATSAAASNLVGDNVEATEPEQTPGSQDPSPSVIGEHAPPISSSPALTGSTGAVPKQVATTLRPKIRSIGFSKISDPPNAEVDIVFVHGLQGHPERSWANSPEKPKPSLRERLLRRSVGVSAAAESVYWPYDFLCKHSDFASSRILIWGYDTKVIRELFGASDQQNISQHGNNLMVMLQQERKSDPTRPLIFVAHSLGGIIVKTVLNISRHSTHQPQYLTIYSSTAGVIFLGTPHGGSGSADWGLLASNLTKLALQGPSRRVLKGLKPNSELLENLRRSFLQMLEDGHFSIHSFYETLPMFGLYGLDGLVVPYDSALVGHAKKEISLGIHGNHSGICKFSTTDDLGYQAVFGALQDYVKAATARPVFGVRLGCKVLEDSKLSAAGRLILAYLVARSFWRYYRSDWMRTNWNLKTIQFLPEEDTGDSDLAFDPYVPFLDLQTPDSVPTAPKEFEGEYGYVHRHPRILILGLLLFQICSRLPYEAKISAQFSPISVNQDCLHFHTSKKQGTWPAPDLNNYNVNAYKNIVAEYFPAPNISNFEGTLLDWELDVPARRALLRKKVAVPLHGLLKGMELFDQEDNIRPAPLNAKTKSWMKPESSSSKMAKAFGAQAEASERATKTEYNFDGVQPRYFETNSNAADAKALIAKSPEVKAALMRGPVYVITGLSIAEGLKYSNHSTADMKTSASGNAHVTDEVELEGKLGGSAVRRNLLSYTMLGDAILAYLLHIIKEVGWAWKRDYEVETYDPGNAGFLDIQQRKAEVGVDAEDLLQDDLIHQ
ncbi:MAG: Ras GTPase ras2 [Geoglossum simile]|nr:MAG: Ras GTPase ras2 [Geoglossum simile]